MLSCPSTTFFHFFSAGVPQRWYQNEPTQYFFVIFKSGGFLTSQARLFLAYSTESVVRKERIYSWYIYCRDASYQFNLGSFLTLSSKTVFFLLQKIVTASVVRSVILVLEN